MDHGQIIYIAIRLFLVVLASFLAILLWSKTRDAAWILIIAGTFAGYGETIYSILTMLNLVNPPKIGTVPIPAFILYSLPTMFFIAAFIVIIIKQSGKN
jgi:hypothetical protein